MKYKMQGNYGNDIAMDRTRETFKLGAYYMKRAVSLISRGKALESGPIIQPRECLCGPIHEH